MFKLRPAIVVDIATIALVSLVTVTEAPLVEDSQRPWYIGFRVAICLALALHALLRKADRSPVYGLIWVAILYFYCATGEYFRPLYIVAVFQVQMIHALYFDHFKRSYAVAHILGSTLFLATLFFVWDQSISRLQQASVGDQVTIVFCTTVTAMLMHWHVETIKKRSERATKKLALVGGYATSLIHDIKNLAAAPLLYSSALNNPGRQLTEAETKTLVGLLNSDLKKMETLVKELYSSSLMNDQDDERIDLRLAVLKAQSVLETRLQGIELSISGDSAVTTDRRILQVILMNLFYNAIQAFPKKTTGEKPRIEIEIRDATLIFKSNSAEASQRETSTGMGLFLMKELSQQTNISITSSIEGKNWITRLQFDQLNYKVLPGALATEQESHLA